MQQGSCLAIEGREAAFMFTQRFFVQPDTSAIISRAEMENGTQVWLRVIVKGFLIPKGAFVPLQFRPLKIPITRHTQSRRGIEIVFDKIPAAERLPIQVKTPCRSFFVRIDDVMPIAVEQYCPPGRNVLDQWRRALRKRDGCRDKSICETSRYPHQAGRYFRRLHVRPHSMNCYQFI